MISFALQIVRYRLINKGNKLTNESFLPLKVVGYVLESEHDESGIAASSGTANLRAIIPPAD